MSHLKRPNPTLQSAPPSLRRTACYSLTNEVLDQIDTLSKERRKSKSEMVYHAVRHYLLNKHYDRIWCERCQDFADKRDGPHCPCMDAQLSDMGHFNADWRGDMATRSIEELEMAEVPDFELIQAKRLHALWSAVPDELKAMVSAPAPDDWDVPEEILRDPEDNWDD